MILELLFCLVLVLYLKWIFISMMYICEALNVFYIHHKTNVLCKMMAVPYHVIEYMLRYGGSRFVILILQKFLLFIFDVYYTKVLVLKSKKM